MYSKGISWIDDCRIPFVDENINFDTKTVRTKGRVIYGGGNGFPIKNNLDDYNNKGRFPANILVCDDMLNDGVISKTSQKNKVIKNTTQMFNYSPQREYPEIQDKGTNSRYYDIDKWFDKIINYE